MSTHPMPKVSILIPCYNTDRWIAQAIDSALNQTYPHKEVIVVDDGSSDCSLEIIQSYGDRIRWETQPNQGGNVARNRLLELSTGDWLQYLDADDYLLAEKLERQHHGLAHCPQAAMIGSPVILEYCQENETRRDDRGISISFDPWVFLAQWRLPQTAGALWRRQSLVDINGWREDLKSCQEYDLYLRALRAGQEFCYLNEPLSVYRQWSESTVCKKDKSDTYRNRLDILDQMEQHLSSTYELTEFRLKALNQSRFDCARIIWLSNQKWATEIIDQVRSSDSTFVPLTVPKLYQVLYQQFGFRVAEQVADFRRGVSR
jgi:glycosyltransferase involved in cell wall biosynthesis